MERKFKISTIEIETTDTSENTVRRQIYPKNKYYASAIEKSDKHGVFRPTRGEKEYMGKHREDYWINIRIINVSFGGSNVIPSTRDEANNSLYERIIMPFSEFQKRGRPAELLIEY